MEVYITDVAAFLPNEPVGVKQMEEVLGMLGPTPSKIREKILKKNQIKTRYYAIDPQTGQTTHTNAQLTAEAVRRLRPSPAFSLEDIECLCCGTSTPDQQMPGHGLMVHGELGEGRFEVMTAAGICLSGVVALKYAAMNVALGLSNNAVATGSEHCSSYLRAPFLNATPPGQRPPPDLDKQPELAFEAEFLRWMLSDAAGAVYLSNQPSPDGLSLRLEWIEHLSSAAETETCMYAGAEKQRDGSLCGWRQLDSPEQALSPQVMAIKQDVSLLIENIGLTAIDHTLLPLLQKHPLDAEKITWFLPHYSSDYFRLPLYNRMKEIGFHIPEERWFTNLTTKGNTGAASIYVILEELFHSGRLQREDQLLCFVPESGRFSNAYFLLTVV